MDEVNLEFQEDKDITNRSYLELLLLFFFVNIVLIYDRDQIFRKVIEFSFLILFYI